MSSVSDCIEVQLKNIERAGYDITKARYLRDYWNGRYQECVVEGEASHGYGSITNALIKKMAFEKYLEKNTRRVNYDVFGL